MAAVAEFRCCAVSCDCDYFIVRISSEALGNTSSFADNAVTWSQSDVTARSSVETTAGGLEQYQ